MSFKKRAWCEKKNVVIDLIERMEMKRKMF